MDKIQPSEIVQDVRKVLETARKGKGSDPQFLTAYQILNRLPQETRGRLITERSMPGKGAGVHQAAASVVMHAIRQIGSEVDVEYFDNSGISFEVAGERITAGYPVCGLYRLRREHPADY